jgi:enamine deaminase RidA (YjgF/YER057c/UK114 family)
MSQPIRFVPTAPGLADPPGYSYAASTAREIVYFAGQVALDDQGNLVGRGDFEAQARQTFKNLRLALSAAGCSAEDVLKVNYYVVGLTRDKLLALRALRNEVFVGDAKPASTLIGVAALFDPDALVEIEVVAGRPA